MSLSGFIRGHHEAIISEFARFAKTLMPPGPEMTEAELRDHAEDILMAVVHDMSIAQSPAEQSLKSRGRGGVKTMEPLGRSTPTIASSTASRSGQCWRNFARSERRCCDSMRKADNRTSPMSAASTKPSTNH